MHDYKPVSIPEFVGKHIKTGLSLDISKTSTGLTFFNDGKITSCAVQFEIKDEASPYATGLRMVELEEAIFELTQGVTHFDVICVEEAILGINSKVSSVAYGLNYFIDYLLASGKVSCDKFHRVNNSSWKKVLRELTGAPTPKVGQDKDKKFVIEAMKRLGYALAYKHETFPSWNAYIKSGYQDMLDSVGLLFATVYMSYFDNRLTKKTVTKKLKIFDSLEKSLKFAKFDIIDANVTPSQLSLWYKGLNKVADKSATYICKADSLGRFGVEQGYLEYHDTYYVVVNVTVKVVQE